MTDKDYEIERNLLIPEALNFVNKQAGKIPDGDREKWNMKWNNAFHTKMNELA